MKEALHKKLDNFQVCFFLFFFFFFLGGGGGSIPLLMYGLRFQVSYFFGTCLLVSIILMIVFNDPLWLNKYSTSLIFFLLFFHNSQTNYQLLISKTTYQPLILIMTGCWKTDTGNFLISIKQNWCYQTILLPLKFSCIREESSEYTFFSLLRYFKCI